MKKRTWLLILKAAALTAAATTFGCMAGSPARADPKADALLAKVMTAYGSATSLSVRLSTAIGAKYKAVVTIQLRKPDLVRMERTNPRLTFLSDGRDEYTLMAHNQYTKRPAIKGVFSRPQWLGGLPIPLFFGRGTLGFGKLSDAGTETKYSGRETVDGVAYDVVTVTGKTPYYYALKVFIGAGGLIGRSILEVSSQDDKTVETSDWLAQKINGVPATTSFAVVLPKGATPYERSVDYTSKLVAIGNPGPAFTLPTPTGGAVSLADSVAGHKAVLVNFWFNSCAPCHEEFPRLQQLYGEFKDKGLDLIAVNRGDNKESIAKYVAENKLTFKIAMAARAPESLPTTACLPIRQPTSSTVRGASFSAVSALRKRA
jgi:thiol-disulfide isomerase/thioredoxin